MRPWVSDRRRRYCRGSRIFSMVCVLLSALAAGRTAPADVSWRFRRCHFNRSIRRFGFACETSAKKSAAALHIRNAAAVRFDMLLSMKRAYSSAAKVAVTVTSAEGITKVVVALLLSADVTPPASQDQPTKCQPASGTAVIFMVLPALKR